MVDTVDSAVVGDAVVAVGTGTALVEVDKQEGSGSWTAASASS